MSNQEQYFKLGEEVIIQSKYYAAFNGNEHTILEVHYTLVRNTITNEITGPQYWYRVDDNCPEGWLQESLRKKPKGNGLTCKEFMQSLKSPETIKGE